MSDPSSYTEEQANRLAAALYAQMERRKAAMALEAAFAHGLQVTAPDFVPPDEWALKACRVASAKIAKLMAVEPGQKDVTASQAGAFVGYAKTWGAVLKAPSGSIDALETKHPALVEYRKKLAVLTDREVALGKNIEGKIAIADMSPLQEIAYGDSRAEGSRLLIDDSGELKENATIKSEVCYFIWLYWQEIKVFEKLPDLMNFLEEFRVEGLTFANLEAIVGDIGLSFKGPGAPCQ